MLGEKGCILFWEKQIELILVPEHKVPCGIPQRGVHGHQCGAKAGLILQVQLHRVLELQDLFCI